MQFGVLMSINMLAVLEKGISRATRNDVSSEDRLRLPPFECGPLELNLSTEFCVLNLRNLGGHYVK